MKTLSDLTHGQVKGLFFYEPDTGYVARIQVNGENIYIGAFTELSDAEEAVRLEYSKHEFHNSHGRDKFDV